jgi:hypothetical protein
MTKERYRFLKPLIHLYKAFGELCEGKSENAENEYKLYEGLCAEFEIADTNLSKNYNKHIMFAYKNFNRNCRESIEEAIKLIPNKPEPYLYLAFDIINNGFELEADPVIKKAYLEEAI